MPLNNAVPVPLSSDIIEKNTSSNIYQRYVFLFNNDDDTELNVNKDSIVNNVQNFISYNLDGRIIFNYRIINGFSFEIKKERQTRYNNLQNHYNLLVKFLDDQWSHLDYVLEKDLVKY